jgi:nucleoside 2-deoxyribosyltransferase
MALVYLSGPITACSYGEATDWRKYAANHLAEGLAPLSPLRGQKYLEGVASIPDHDEAAIFGSKKGLTSLDRNDVKRCDAVLVNLLGAQRVSLGTVMEIAWADAWDKPIVLVDEPGSLHEHAMISTVAEYTVDDLNTGVEVVNALLTPGA